MGMGWSTVILLQDLLLGTNLSLTFIVHQESPTQSTLSIQISKCKKCMVTFAQICHINNLSCSHTYSKKTCSVACEEAHHCCTTVCSIASNYCFCVQRKYIISNIIQLELYMYIWYGQLFCKTKTKKHSYFIKAKTIIMTALVDLLLRTAMELN